MGDKPGPYRNSGRVFQVFFLRFSFPNERITLISDEVPCYDFARLLRIQQANHKRILNFILSHLVDRVGQYRTV